MKLIDLINKMHKYDINVGFTFTLKYKEFTLNTYEIRECAYGLMIWDLDNEQRFDSCEYILDYLDWNVMKVVEIDPKYIRLKEENQKLKTKIKELVKHAFVSEMTLGEFKVFYKLATGKEYDPSKGIEAE